MRKALIFAGLLAANGQLALANQPAIDAGKALLERQLVDPGSVQYRDVKAYQAGEHWLVCGEMNAKNRAGGYNGFKRFYVSNGSAAIDGPDERNFELLFSAICAEWPN